MSADTPLPAETPVEVLVSAALSGDLLFAGISDVDMVSIYASALQDLSGASPKAQVARPTAQPEDLARMLAHADTADLAHGMLCSLLIDHARVPGSMKPRDYLLNGYNLGADPKAGNLARLPMVGPGLMAALLEDFERRVTALAASTMGSSEAASSESCQKLAHQMGTSAAMLLAIHQLYNDTLLAPRVRAMGFERFTRNCALGIKAAFAALPACVHSVHLVVAFLWGRVHADIIYYWEKCGEASVSTVMVADEWNQAMRSAGPALAQAIVPIALTDNSAVLKSRAWASAHMSILDDSSVSDAFARAGGLSALLREATDAANKNTYILLIAFSNGARFTATATKAVELDAHAKLQPLIFHDSTRVSFFACHTICLLANHQDTQGAVEASGCLSDVTGALRMLTVPYSTIETGDGFAEPDVLAMISLCKTDNPLALRLCAAMKLSGYCRAANNSFIKSLKDPLSLLQRLGVDAVARTMCTDPDAFLYLAGTAILQSLNLPLPMYRDPARAAAAAAAATHEASVLTWSIDAVCEWVGRQPFRQYRQLFREALVDGTSLATLSEAELVDMGVGSLLHRKAVRGAIGRLLFRSGLAYEHAVVAASPAAASAFAEEAEGAGQLLHAVDGTGVGLGSTPFFTPSRGLRSGGGGGGGMTSGGGSSSSSSSAEDAAEAARKDVFISYRRKTGAVLARLLDLHLRMAGLKTFLDVENLGTGAFDVALKSQLTGANNVVVILSDGALDRCLTDHDNKDFVRKEIAMALATGKNTVPVMMDDFKFPPEEQLPEDIRGITKQNAVPWNHYYQEASVKQLLSFLKR